MPWSRRPWRRDVASLFLKISYTSKFWPFSLAQQPDRWSQETAQVWRQLLHAPTPPFSLCFQARKGPISTKIHGNPACSLGGSSSLPPLLGMLLSAAGTSLKPSLFALLLDFTGSSFALLFPSGQCWLGTENAGFPLLQKTYL